MMTKGKRILENNPHPRPLSHKARGEFSSAAGEPSVPGQLFSLDPDSGFARACWWLALVLLTLAGVGLVLRATARGAGISPDSTAYISMAREMLIPFGFHFVLQGGGDFPPLYPALLAVGGSLTGDPASAARWINALLLGCNLILVTLMLKRILPRSFWTPLVGAGLFLTSVTMLTIHAMAWSEPTLLFFGLSGMLLLAAYFTRPQLWRLLLAAVAMGLAAMDRYVGIIPPLDYFQMGYNTISTWVVPAGIPLLTQQRPLILNGGAILLTLGVLYVWRRLARRTSPRELLAQVPPLFYVAALFTLLYPLVHVLARTFLGPSLEWDSRARSPIFVTGLVVVISIVSVIFSVTVSQNLFARLVLAGLAIAVLSHTANSAWRYVQRSHNRGLGYAGVEWQESPTIAQVRQLPPDVLVYSNGSDAIYFLTARPAIRLPNKTDKMNLIENKKYLDDLGKVGMQVAAGRAVIVYLDKFPDRWFQPSEQDLTRALPLRVLTRQADGVILK